MKTRPNRKYGLRLGAVALAAAGLLLPSCKEKDGFTMADTDGDARVSPVEFSRYMLEVIFAEADADGDAKVTFEEWQKANPDAEENKFYAPDKDGDKMVNPEEAKAHFERQGTMTDLFKKIDTDKDGYLNREEVVDFTEKMEAQSGSTKLQKLQQATSES
jgi:Ca2+-binding EF-hand superfamily protein